MTAKVSVAGATADAVASVIDQLVAERVASRIAAKDFTLWGKEAEDESSKRLGWVTSATDSADLVEPILALKSEFAAKGVTRFVLCGMGGSSLAPEVITRTAGVELIVLDSTEPSQVQAALDGDLAKTAVVVSSKSGSTVETDSQKRIFEQAFTAAGLDKTDRIVIVTDPGSPMEAAAKADGYRIFNADPTVGGRYSALTAFGLVPSGLAGADIAQLLSDAAAAGQVFAQDSVANPALVLGAAMARTASHNGFRDKLGVLCDGTSIVGFGDWAEQLIAESTGKIDKGVLPVVLEAQSVEVSKHPADLVLARVVADASEAKDGEISVSGSLGEQFLLWEYATVIASRLIGINPFDQPDVESAKIAARGMLEQRAEISAPRFVSEGVEVRTTSLNIADAETLGQAIRGLFAELANDGFVSVQAYLNRTAVPQAAELRDQIAAATGRPTTFGWAPRFLHSTGQYHKGGPKQGVYLQITCNPSTDLSVPGRDFTFGELIASQAAGDAAVLGNLGRPVLTLTLTDVAAGLAAIKNAIG
jgi:glucose-6-phosphate isomerase